MFELEKTFHFESGHLLTHHKGQCARPHGHSYRLTVRFRNDQLHPSGPETNMVMDFGNVTAIVQPMIERYFDHQWLNDTLDTDSPTSEWIARWAYHHLKPLLPLLYSVTIAETNSSSATYWE